MAAEPGVCEPAKIQSPKTLICTLSSVKIKQALFCVFKFILQHTNTSFYNVVKQTNKQGLDKSFSEEKTHYMHFRRLNTPPSLCDKPHGSFPACTVSAENAQPSTPSWKGFGVRFSAGAEDAASQQDGSSSSSSSASLGRHGQAGKQGRCPLAALGRHVLQALCVEPVEVQPEGQEAISFSSWPACRRPGAAHGPDALPRAPRAAAHALVEVLTGSKEMQK